MRLDLEVTVRRTRQALAWGTFLRSAGNPNLPPLGVLLNEVLTPAELTTFALTCVRSWKEVRALSAARSPI